MCFTYFYCFVIIGWPLSQSKDDAVFSSKNDRFDLEKSNWMECIPDGTKFFALSIPGTHDSGSYDAQIIPAVRTQAMKWSVQFHMGIRAFDIRILYSIKKDLFTMHHGFMQVNSMENFLKEARDFLNAHPSEAFVFRLKQEFKDLRAHLAKDEEQLNINMKARMGRYVEEYSEYFFKPSDSQFTIGEVRRKMIILSDNRYFDDFGLPYTICQTQDKWQVSVFSLYDKWTRIKSHMQTALTGEPGQCFMNYLSAAVKILPLDAASGKILGFKLWTGHYYPSAKYPEFPHSKCHIFKQCVYFGGMNAMTRNYLKADITTMQLDSERAYGIFYSDFADNTLVDAILKSNARLRGVFSNPADLADPKKNFAHMCHGTSPQKAPTRKGLFKIFRMSRSELTEEAKSLHRKVMGLFGRP